ncbi:hypothetical protein CCH79_00017614 [Gambusia affinis]|uniref:SCAN box domain-containing protein n=1 Tax=Gambusia affinis TaxID=33528 RepID=A0A315URV9_GAMAF|nr:hypothetical protein CCH79_00017614 [Gambusia affinis]
MDLVDSEDYEKLKAATLQKYEITAETYRQRFRSLDILLGETPQELYVCLKEMFFKWVKLDKATVKEIAETLILEQFLRMVNPEPELSISLFPPLSSTLALLVLVAVLVGIILVSLATFLFHKRKLRNRKIQRAQEEYERDSRSPARAGTGAGEPARPCVIVRPVRRDEKPSSRSVGSEDKQTVPLDYYNENETVLDSNSLHAVVELGAPCSLKA